VVASAILRCCGARGGSVTGGRIVCCCELRPAARGDFMMARNPSRRRRDGISESLHAIRRDGGSVILPGIMGAIGSRHDEPMTSLIFGPACVGIRRMALPHALQSTRSPRVRRYRHGLIARDIATGPVP